MPEPDATRELVNALARAGGGRSPDQLLAEPEIDALYNHATELQADLETLVSRGVLRCRESPGSLRYVLAPGTEPSVAEAGGDPGSTGLSGRGRPDARSFGGSPPPEAHRP